jgi:hypothetical protein
MTKIAGSGSGLISQRHGSATRSSRILYIVRKADLTVGRDVPNDALGQIVADGQNTGVTLPSQNSTVN